MENTFKFIQITLLGLMVGIMIVLLLQVNYWANDIKMTIRRSVVYQNNEFVKKKLEEKLRKPPACKVPDKPKYRI